MTKIQSKIHTFFDASFWIAFFSILARPGAKKLDFGPPWHPAGIQNGAQNRASLAKRLKKNDRGAHLLGLLEPTCFKDRFLSATWHHFDRFWIDFA